MWNGLAHVRKAAAAVATVALLAGGCASQSAMGPSPAPSTPTPTAPVTQDELTVRVLSRNSEVPIAGAAVQAEQTNMLTDATGIAVLRVVAGAELEVNVSASGYEPMAATAVLGPNERWTFYLQSVQ